MSVPWPDALVVREGQPVTRLTEIPPGDDPVRSVPETAVLQEQARVEVLREVQPITRLIETSGAPPPAPAGGNSDGSRWKVLFTNAGDVLLLNDGRIATGRR